MSTRHLHSLLALLGTLLMLSARAFALNATWNTASDVPVTATSYTASGTVNFTLNFAPTTGTNLTVVNNTGLGFISGTFSNLAQGQAVVLSYGGTNYTFVANYYGGTGNDLVLQWATIRPVAWGAGGDGQLGNNSTTNSGVPVAMVQSGVLAGETVVAFAAGYGHNLALCSDGTLAAWGLNTSGQLGNNSTTQSNVPTAVVQSGVLAGKTVIAVAAGYYHSLALCSDGTVAAWGQNSAGQLGNNSTTQSNVPVAVYQSGVLAGKTVIAVAAGQYHSLALCSDGTLAAWGGDGDGQLGNNSTSTSSVPVAVVQSGVLAGKTVVAITAGESQNFALCSNGTVAAWGYGGDGELGNNSTTNSGVPVAVTQSGVLAGKTIVAVAAGDDHCLALCSDGSLSAWGYNYYGQLGNNSTTNSSVPVAVVQSGVLAGKTIIAVTAAYADSLVLCSDGTVAAWGYNASGELGNNSTAQSNVPVAVNSSGLASGERFVAVRSGPLAFDGLALVASQPPPTVATLAATAITLTGATLNGTVNANNNGAVVSFDYGATTSYGTNVAATPASVTGSTVTPVSVNVTGLSPGTTYHFRVNGVSAAGASNGNDVTFRTISTNAQLANLALSAGSLSPSFASGTTSYTASTTSSSVTVTPTAADATATVTVNGTPVASGSVSGPIALNPGANTIAVVVTAQDGVTTQSYTVSVTPVPLAWTYNSATDVPVTASSYSASGTATLALNFAPPAGTNLTVVNNTGPGSISGAFSNLAQGQVVTLSYGGLNYGFVVNYFGGTGNDLVLEWAAVRPVAWGYNNSGQLGNNSTTNSTVPVALSQSGVLANKTVLAMAAGGGHSLALCSDGTVAAWGSNGYGQLGNNSTTNSSVPVAVVQSGVLAGKTIVAVASGDDHSLALCSDGSLAAWGYNGYGQLGNNSNLTSSVPVAVVQTSGMLAGKTVVAIAAGGNHSLALCSDGTLAAWGFNSTGQLGNNSTTSSNVPVAVAQSGVLAGKTIVAMAAGEYHSLVLCSDGTLAAWGYNFSGQLGDNSTTQSNVPVAVVQSGVLAGKTVIAIAAGGDHGLALCSDGSLAAWGDNSTGELGNNSTSNGNVPVAVVQSGVLAGKTVIAVSAGVYHSLVLCSDGSVAAWGYNADGELGNNSTIQSKVPVAVSTSTLAAGERFVAVRSGPGAGHALALVASGPAPTVATLAATAITPTSATLNGVVNANSNGASVSFDYGATTSYGTNVAGTPPSVTGSSVTPVSVNLTGLNPATIYHFRVNGVNVAGTSNGNDLTFTTISTNAQLANLALSTGSLSPSFASGTTSYTANVNSISSITVTPTVADATATVTVNGTPVTSGSASGAINLSVGTNTITVVVTAQDGVTIQTYTVAVTRTPLTWTYNAATDVPATASSYSPTGSATLALNFAPPTGTNLMVVNNTGPGFISGAFSNLAQGQVVTLGYGGVNYAFVVNYYGGTGNDLVLEWATVRPVAWGSNGLGQLGNNSTTPSNVPMPVLQGGVLAGKTVIGMAAGVVHSLALCSDGSVAAWGYNSNGGLGNNSTAQSTVPVAVVQSGVLAGKTIVATAAGSGYSLALCSDGTLAGWGYNDEGELGNGANADTDVPVAVVQTGALAGKTVVAVAAGDEHSLALCSDGTVAAWGNGYDGQLGGGTTDSNVPVSVYPGGVLAGKMVITVAAGGAHSLALCSDGTLVAWGDNSNGQLGNNSTTNSGPVAVVQSGVLAGKTVIAVSAGDAHSLALCSDGTVAAWGSNYYGQLGNNSTTDSHVPVAVVQSGVLAGKTVIAVSAGNTHSLALCSDGTLAAWGYNVDGELGNNSTTQSNVPVAVSASTLAAGERFVAVRSGPGADYTLALVAAGPAPSATTLAASSITLTSATLNGVVNANNNSSAVSFDYGADTTYGTNVAGTPASVTGSSATAVSATLTGLTPGTTYHFRVNGVNAAGTSNGNDVTFRTISTNAQLANLTLSAGSLSPAFATGTTSYTASTTSSLITVTPTVADATATVTVNGTPVASGSVSGPIALNPGANTIAVVVTAQDGVTTQTYTVTVTPVPLAWTYNAASDVPVTTSTYGASGTATLALNFAPPTGTNLLVVNNTGLGFISGAFSNLAQGQVVTLGYGGVNYTFVVNYYGGTGNDLVLQWAAVRPVTWGDNYNGELGNNSTTNSSVPVAVVQSGVLAGKTVVAMSAGEYHSVALCSDGSLAAWGYNEDGELGNNSTTNSSVPVAVIQSGVLAGKTVVAVATGEYHSLALCSDGTLAAWGFNGSGQLGNNSNSTSSVPVAVFHGGALAGKAVIAIAAGGYHSLALCSDGTLTAWGNDNYGQLGDGDPNGEYAAVPEVVQSGVLAGKTVIAAAAGGAHSLALCSDGTLAAFGYNAYGQLGNNSTTNSSVPVAVVQSGVLAGKTVTGLAAGSDHTLALCSDGTVAAWGYDGAGQLGNNSTTNSSVPVAVVQSGVLAGKTVVAVTAGNVHSLALCSDGTLAAWGDNYYGELGSGAGMQSFVPVAVSASTLNAGERFVRASSGQCAYHTLALVASPPPPAPPAVTTLAASSITVTGATLNGTVNPNGQATAAQFQYGVNTSYDSTATATLSPSNGTSTQTVSANLTGLLPGTTYHYRLTASSNNGTTNSGDVTFTTAFTPSAWRQAWYGTAMNTGSAADTADPYGKGLQNLMTFAYLGPGQNPAQAAPGQLPQPQRVGGNYVISFTQPVGVSGVTYGAMWSATLAAGGWLPVADTGSGTTHTFSVPIGGNTQIFMELMVTEQ